ncbi:helix-turn-helix domain-containing protein [Robertmurraya korlensis]|uniref:helix-turn-helix domain-containing protein n=1 Tax=Robertmurraya korlensis TaxID=519977 RepID=UPI002041FD82|nr:helix-turn-helix transcriptional regulator [Robertmurraya korlensis]MCM3600563.1 helix-turn-helix domain-containing protein [Robertmurraya korlensis]
MTAIGQNIKRFREELEMSQQDLAIKIRVGTATIDKYESGLQTPDTQTILKISTVLDIPVSELMQEESHI